MKYEISFIIPIFNKELSQLKQCINSIQKIYNRKIEIIIIDDGSDSEKSNKYRKLICDEEKIKYFYQPNSGVAQARNTGLAQAKGKYVFFVDADDEIVASELTKINFETESSEFIIFDVEKTDVNTKHTSIYKLSDQKLSQHTLLVQMMRDGLLNWSVAKLYLREWLIQNSIMFDNSLKIGEDLDFVYRVIDKVKKVKYINEIAYKYLFSSKTGVDRIIQFPRKNLKDTLHIYKIRKKIIKRIYPKKIEKYKVLIQEDAIDGYFYIFKVISKNRSIESTKLYELLSSYINYLDDIQKVSFKRKIKAIIMKNKIKLLTKFYEIYNQWI